MYNPIYPCPQFVRNELTLDMVNWAFCIGATLAGEWQGTQVDVRLVLGKTMLLEAAVPVNEARVSQTLALPDPGLNGRNEFLWSSERPMPLDLSLTLRRGQEVLDQVAGHTTMRSVEAQEGMFHLGALQSP
jgi:hypothetical protein